MNQIPSTFLGSFNLLAIARFWLAVALLAVAVPSAYSVEACVAAPSGLVGLWRGDGNANDSVGTNHGQFLFGGTTGAGLVGQALSFNASAARMSVPDNAAFQLTNSLTIEGWLFVKGHGGFIFFRGDSRSQLDPYALTMTFDGRVSFHIESETALINLEAPIGFNEWKHVAATLDGASGAMKIYINGALAAQTNTTVRPLKTLNPSFDPAIGIGNHGGTSHNFGFNGLIDEISLYSRALAANEVQAIYNAGAMGKCQSIPVGVAPTISSHPQNRTVTAGTNVSFAVVADGTAPLNYQWRFNGTNIAGASGSSFLLSNVQPSNAGNYSVVVTNLYGSRTSSNALLTVNIGTTNCVEAPSGLVSWWPGEKETLGKDIVGGNDIAPGPIAGNPGKVGNALLFSSGTNQVRVPASPSLNVGLASGFTIDAWINPVNVATERPLVEWNSGSFGTHFWISVTGSQGGGPGSLYANIKDVNLQDHLISTGPGLIKSNQFQHVAVTYNKGTGEAALYVNGLMVTNKNLGVFTPMTSGDLYFGVRPFDGGANTRYLGLIDEIDLFNRALSSSEILSIYNSGSVGKCAPPAGIAPTIVTHPQSRAVIAGTNVQFTVVANGTGPLSYRWRFNGTNIANATQSSYTLTNVQPANAGNYSVIISNSVGSLASSNALLTVLVPECASPRSGLVAWWKGEDNALDELGVSNGTMLFGAGFAAGKVGKAFNFVATSGRMTVPDSEVFKLTNSLTIEGWVFVKGNGGFIFFRGDSRTQKDPYALTMTGDGQISFHIESETALINLNTPIASNEWKHVAATLDGFNGNMRIFINGALAAQTNTTIRPLRNLDPGSDPAIGIGNHGGTSHNFGFNGLIDEISLYNRALIPDEIVAIYSAGLSGKCGAAPIFFTLPQNRVVNEGANVTFSVLAGGSQPMSYQWRLGSTNIPGATGRSLTLNNVVKSNQGSYTVTVTNAYGLRSANALLSVNRIPVAHGQTVSLNEDTPTAILLAGSDADGNPLTYIVDAPTNGLLGGTAPNLTYTPAANFNGSDSFTFRVNDGLANSTLATVSITVLPVNDLSTALPQTVSVNEDSSVAITLSATDPDGDLLSYVVTTTPGRGTLTGTAPSLVYTPNTNYFGSDSFKFTVSDAVGSSEATVTINVASVNDLPKADIKVSPLAKFAGITNLIVISGNGSNALVVLDGSASSDADGDALQYAWHYGTNAPFAFDVLTTNWFDVGTLDMNLTVTDGIDSDTASVTIEIITASDAIGILVELLEGSNAKTKPLIVSLASAAASFERGDEQAGCNQLEAFKNKVEVQVKDPTTAEWLIKAADEILKVFKTPKSVKMPALHLERNEEPVFQITE